MRSQGLCRRPLTRRRGGAGTEGARLRRAVAMLEFALILPCFLLMLVFAFDMGHLVLMSGAVQDATFTAARTGAQLGGAGVAVPSGSIVCTNGGNCSAGEAWASLNDAVSQIPTANNLGVAHSLQMQVVHGAKCTTGADDHVVIHSQYKVRLLTPGLGALMRMVSTKGDSGAALDEWPISATAVARCEIVRP